MQEHDVVGIGNAIVDIIGRCDDAFLARFGCAKGSMQLVDAVTVPKLYDAMGPGIEISGGSVANTMVGIASFGGRAGFIGKTADDQFGQIFRHDIRAAGVTFTTAAAAGAEPTGRSLILVTPDGQRTMNTFLGVSPQLGGGEMDAELVRSARIVYLEGYLFDRPEAKAAFRQAADIAAKAGRQVALSLSDPFCVDRHRAEFLELIRKSVDILFANEAEITSLYEIHRSTRRRSGPRPTPSWPALTRSEKGSVILGGGRSIAIPAAPVAKVVDTTGAGDLFAAGFLYGVATGRTWRRPAGSAAWRQPRSSPTSARTGGSAAGSWRGKQGPDAETRDGGTGERLRCRRPSPARGCGGPCRTLQWLSVRTTMPTARPCPAALSLFLGRAAHPLRACLRASSTVIGGKVADDEPRHLAAPSADPLLHQPHALAARQHAQAQPLSCVSHRYRVLPLRLDAVRSVSISRVYSSPWP